MKKLKTRPTTRILLSIYTGFLFTFLYLPLLLLAKTSLQGGPNWWHWYEKAFENEALLRALENSVWIGLGATVLSVLFGTLAAFSLRDGKLPGQHWIESILNLPLVLPEIVMSLSLLVWFVFIGMTLGLWSVILAHTLFCMPYVILMVRARFATLDPLLEEAAADLGATRWQVFHKVLFPLLLPAIISSALLAFTLSFDDFLITFFTGGIESDTLPVQLYSMMRFGIKPEMNAISVTILLITFSSVFLISRLKVKT